jgi:GNAT superfamily N-acetyltransferase
MAAEADSGVLSEIERGSPIEVGERAIAIDRGDDYFAASRLMGDVVVLLAEVDGQPAAALCAAFHRAMIGGVERKMAYIHHARVLPEFQRQGVGRAISARLREIINERGADSDYWYISVGNTKSQAFARAATNRWRVQPRWATLDAATLAGPPCGRPATPADAERIAVIVNACHRGEEMFLPYTAASLTARMERAPDMYSWGNARIGEGAVAGVWLEGDWINVRVSGPDGPEAVSRGAAVLDYGCVAGAEGELAVLLRGWCEELAARGFDELTIFTCPGTHAWPVISSLTDEIAAFDFWTPALPEPEGAAGRGLYVDHVYF